MTVSETFYSVRKKTSQLNGKMDFHLVLADADRRDRLGQLGQAAAAAQSICAPVDGPANRTRDLAQGLELSV